SADAVMGLCAPHVFTGTWRVSAAVLCARRLGCCPGTSERAFAERGSRFHAWICVSMRGVTRGVGRCVGNSVCQAHELRNGDGVDSRDGVCGHSFFYRPRAREERDRIQSCITLGLEYLGAHYFCQMLIPICQRKNPTAWRRYNQRSCAALGEPAGGRGEPQTWM